ncbi:hypothetical protein RFI_07576, partial [Reticulomyxa filosa]
MFTVFERAPVDVLPSSQEYKDWYNKMEESFYCHGPTLLLLTMIFTNKAVVDKKSEYNFHRSLILQTALEKVILANVYLVDKNRLLNSRNFYLILYAVKLLRQFFRNEKRYTIHIHICISNINIDQMKYITYIKCPSQGTRRIRLHKKPIALSNPRARTNLLDFIQAWINPVLDVLGEEVEQKRMLNQSTEELEEIGRQLEISIAECLVGLINLGSIGEPKLERKLLNSLEKNLLHSNPRLRELAQNGMDAIFKYNGHLINHFIEQSCRLHSYIHIRIHIYVYYVYIYLFIYLFIYVYKQNTSNGVIVFYIFSLCLLKDYNEFISLGLSDNQLDKRRGTRLLSSHNDDEKVNLSIGNIPQPSLSAPLPIPSTAPLAAVAKRPSGKPKRLSLFLSGNGNSNNNLESEPRHKVTLSHTHWRQTKDGESTHASTSAVTEISLGYLRSLVNNFVGNMQAYESHGLNGVEALALVMLHLCSPHQEARQLAAKLADFMKKSRPA